MICSVLDGHFFFLFHTFESNQIRILVLFSVLQSGAALQCAVHAS